MFSAAVSASLSSLRFPTFIIRNSSIFCTSLDAKKPQKKKKKIKIKHRFPYYVLVKSAKHAPQKKIKPKIKFTNI